MKKTWSCILSIALVLGMIPAGVFASGGQVYAAGSLTEDAFSEKQWALENDGSFVMEEEQNDFSVYDNPFEMPSAPGQWKKPDGFNDIGGPGGMYFRRNSAAEGGETAAAQAGVDINVSEAWEVYDGGSRETIIALIDTGVDYTHEELADAVWVNEDEIAGNGIDDDGNGYIDDVYGWNFYDNSNLVYTSAEDDSHGTHGAGTMAAAKDNETGIAGIADSDNVKIMILKALGGSDGTGTTDALVRAIQYAEANGAVICNLSLCSETDDVSLYNAMASSDMLFVCAAGNESADADSSPVYPACYSLDNIISVANLNYNGSLHSSSNYGAVSVDLAAPGSYILSTTPQSGYSYMTGTSMAAPMVSASAAMLYSYFDDITRKDVKEIILNSVTQMDSLSGNTVSGGMLNLGACMEYDTSLLSHEDWEEVSLREETRISQPVMMMPPDSGFPNDSRGFDEGNGQNPMQPGDGNGWNRQPGGNGGNRQQPGGNGWNNPQSGGSGWTDRMPGQGGMQFLFYSLPGTQTQRMILIFR